MMPKYGRILAVDTSSQVLSVSVANDKGSICELNLSGTPRHSEQLIDLIKQGLDALQMKKEDLECLIWGKGPGSFTGLRIGFAVLKGLYCSLKKPCYGISSLDLIAAGTGLIEGNLIVCVDARRGKIYTASYEFSAGRFKRNGREAVVDPDEFLKMVLPGTYVVGDGLARYGNDLKKHISSAFTFERTFWYPRSSTIIRLYEQDVKWVETLNQANMNPAYLRLSEAEENLKPKAK